jgi:hypothetical protein
VNALSLRTVLLLIAFMGAQVCCCHGWAMIAAAGVGQVTDGEAVASVCCRSCPDAPEQEPVSPIPCEDHEACTACNLRLSTAPEPSLPEHDAFGEVVVLPEPIFEGLTHQSLADHRNIRPESALACSLVELRCALVI